MKKHTLTNTYLPVVFNCIRNVNKGCGVLGLGRERGGTRRRRWKLDGGKKRNWMSQNVTPLSVPDGDYHNTSTSEKT